MSDELVEIHLYPLDAEGNDISAREPRLSGEGMGHEVPAPGDFLDAGGKQ